MRTLRQKVDVELKDARVGWRLEGVKNAYPSSESASTMRPLRQKVELRDGIEPPSRTPPSRWSKTLFLLNHTSFLVYSIRCAPARRPS